MTARLPAWRAGSCVLSLVMVLLATLIGCNPQHGEGPGGRVQHLALTPEQEAQLGEQAYRETLARARPVSDARLERVKRVGQRIEKAAAIDLLRREINLHIDDKLMNWQYAVLDNDKTVNAFCLPGGKVAVYTGLLRVA